MSTTMFRKTTCKGCGYTQATATTYYLDRKQWEANHDLTACRIAKMSVATARV